MNPVQMNIFPVPVVLNKMMLNCHCFLALFSHGLTGHDISRSSDMIFVSFVDKEFKYDYGDTSRIVLNFIFHGTSENHFILYRFCQLHSCECLWLSCSPDLDPNISVGGS
jgi:hypothetical protein